MILSTTKTSLSTVTKKITKVRYFSVELSCMGMIPETNYDFFVDGVNMNSFCRPFGKNLGDPIIAGKDGKVLIQYHMSIPYDQQYLTTKIDEGGYMAKSKLFELRDPNGNSSVTYYPIRLKVTQ